MLCGCASATPTEASTPTTAPSATVSNSPSPLPSDTPTPTLPPTETPEQIAIDPSLPPNLWSADVQARFPEVIKNPDTSTPAKRQAYDTYLTTQWKLMLKDSGGANADTLQGNSFLDAISSYAHEHNMIEVDLPMSLIRATILNPDNLIPFGALAPGEDPNSRDSYYGIGENSSWQTKQQLIGWAEDFTHVTIFGNYIDNLANTPTSLTFFSVSGKVNILVNIPGVDPEAAQGILVRMIGSDGSVGFAISYIVYQNPQMIQTKSTDICEKLVGNHFIEADCGAEISMGATRINTVKKLRLYYPLTRELMLALLHNNNPLRVEMFPGQEVRIDGMSVSDAITLSSNINLDAARADVPASSPTPTP
jgi:hypothetical protein